MDPTHRQIWSVRYLCQAEWHGGGDYVFVPYLLCVCVQLNLDTAGQISLKLAHSQ